MFENLGVLFALVALFGWAFGDFSIQRATRVFGWYKTLFAIGALGFVGLLPFVTAEIGQYTLQDLYPLLVLSAIVLAYAWAIFEALRLGKISVVEAVVAFELPLTVSLGVFVGGESLSALHVFLFILTCIGILLVVVRRFDYIDHPRRLLEKGVLLAFLGAFLSALTNFYIGTYSESMSPLFVIWFTHSMLAVVCAVYIAYRGEFRELWRQMLKHPIPIWGAAIFDNIAWVGYALATSMIPISLTVTLSESYIALAALLGYVFGGEKLKTHQLVGALITFVSAGILSATL